MTPPTSGRGVEATIPRRSAFPDADPTVMLRPHGDVHGCHTLPGHHGGRRAERAVDGRGRVRVLPRCRLSGVTPDLEPRPCRRDDGPRSRVPRPSADAGLPPPAEG
ncbi:hypothetical protein GCM10027261_01220 [Geodermatophilus arenarius]